MSKIKQDNSWNFPWTRAEHLTLTFEEKQARIVAANAARAIAKREAKQEAKRQREEDNAVYNQKLRIETQMQVDKLWADYKRAKR